jgi:hypothetical protein
MDGLSVKVKTTNGVEVSYKLTPRVIVAFEQNFGAGLPKLLGEQQKIEHLYWLAWKCQQIDAQNNGGTPVKLFGPEYLDTIVSAELESDSSFESTATV